MKLDALDLELEAFISGCVVQGSGEQIKILLSECFRKKRLPKAFIQTKFTRKQLSYFLTAKIKNKQ